MRNSRAFLVALHRSGCMLVIHSCSVRLGDEVMVRSDGRMFMARVIDCDRPPLRVGWGDEDEVKEKRS
jgi:hypothetical protein